MLSPCAGKSFPKLIVSAVYAKEICSCLSAVAVERVPVLPLCIPYSIAFQDEPSHNSSKNASNEFASRTGPRRSRQKCQSDFFQPSDIVRIDQLHNVGVSSDKSHLSILPLLPPSTNIELAHPATTAVHESALEQFDMAPAIDDAEKYLATGERPDEIYGFTTTPRRQGGIRGFMGRSMDLLVKHGVEERGIQPRPEDVS